MICPPGARTLAPKTRDTARREQRQAKDLGHVVGLDRPALAAPPSDRGQDRAYRDGPRSLQVPRFRLDWRRRGTSGRRASIVCLLVPASLVLTISTPCAQDETRAPFGKIVPALFEQHAVPGAAVALVREGELVWADGFGMADVSAARPITADTIFNIGSISKVVTAWGVMRLVERGELDLDARPGPDPRLAGRSPSLRTAARASPNAR